ncbi:hypothetical protein [Xenococcus sp. PCC 7305]|uniref:hypothetical protein n=1 Tax=Xenococcus sp. PCC 7305 TaxID=102125 RepID=UPI001181A244|nr:hypothetical protein [Xenococcus sp. PCC 7305]
MLASNLRDVQLSSVSAQSLRPNSVAEQVYQLIPELPLENQYLSQETREVATNNTLISRFVRYHQYVKSRPVKFRLDWKFTIADYLEANEPISYDRYPGSKTLSNHPLEGDRAVIYNLSRSQRNQLIDTLVSIYNPTSSEVPKTTNDSSNPSNNNSNNRPRLPQPGDADLLR